jgi:hypothetical protein
MTKTSLERLNQQEPLPEWHIMEALRRLSVLAAQMTYVVTALGFFEQHICAHDFLSALQQNGCCDSPKWRVFPSNAKIRAQPQSRILLFCDAHIKQYAAQSEVYDPIGVLDIWGLSDER